MLISRLAKLLHAVEATIKHIVIFLFLGKKRRPRPDGAFVMPTAATQGTSPA